jgi:hypothetical protein
LKAPQNALWRLAALVYRMHRKNLLGEIDAE